MRKFKRLDGDLAEFSPAAVGRFEFDAEPTHLVTQLCGLRRERVGVDLFEQPQVEELVLLTTQQRDLAAQLGLALAVGVLLAAGTLTQHKGEPVADLFVFDLQAVEEAEHLAIEVGFGQPDAGMALRGVARAAVVTVDAYARLADPLDRFARDRPAAVTAGNQIAGVGQLVGAVNLATKELLHAVERRPIDERLVRSNEPLLFVGDLA